VRWILTTSAKKGELRKGVVPSLVWKTRTRSVGHSSTLYLSANNLGVSYKGYYAKLIPSLRWLNSTHAYKWSYGVTG
jgi:hypothetical protein